MFTVWLYAGFVHSLAFVHNLALFTIWLCSQNDFVYHLALFTEWLCSQPGFVHSLALSQSGFVHSLALFTIWLYSGFVHNLALSTVWFVPHFAVFIRPSPPPMLLFAWFKLNEKRCVCVCVCACVHACVRACLHTHWHSHTIQTRYLFTVVAQSQLRGS